MTDTTHEAPERIWATMMDPECARSGTFVDLKEYPTKPNYDAIEYIRADFVQAAVAAALREAAERMRHAAATEDEFGRTINAAIFDTAVKLILALITEDAQAALDRAIAAAIGKGRE